MGLGFGNPGKGDVDRELGEGVRDRGTGALSLGTVGFASTGEVFGFGNPGKGDVFRFDCSEDDVDLRLGFMGTRELPRRSGVVRGDGAGTGKTFPPDGVKVVCVGLGNLGLLGIAVFGGGVFEPL